MISKNGPSYSTMMLKAYYTMMLNAYSTMMLKAYSIMMLNKSCVTNNGYLFDFSPFLETFARDVPLHVSFYHMY